MSGNEKCDEISCGLKDISLSNPWLTSRWSIWTSEECENVSRSIVSDSLQPHGLQLNKFLAPWNSPGKNTGVGCHSFLQRIFPIQGSKAFEGRFFYFFKSTKYIIHITHFINC